MKYKDIKKLTGILLLSVGLSSCQVFNRYTAPKIDTENLFRDREETDTTSIANIPWREYFRDPALQSLIEEALLNNYDMQIALERVKQAEATLGMARAAYFPDLTLSGQFEQTRLSSSDPLTGTARERNTLAYHKETYTLGLVTTWELDLWGRMNRDSRAKYAQMLNSYAGQYLVKTTLISNLANTYYSLLALDEQLRVTQNMIELMKENLITTIALRDAGMTTGAAVKQTEAALYGAQASVSDLENNIRQLENSISTLLGRKPGPIQRTLLNQQAVPTELAYGIPVQMLAKRPDVQQAELAFRAAFELTNVARASFYPSIKLTTGLLGYTTVNGLSQFFKPEHLFASIIGGLTQPIFARRQLITQLEIAKADQRAALFTFEKTVLSASEEVSGILSTFELSLRKIQSRNLQVESLEQAVYFTQELLKAGEANYLEVLTAQQSLLNAKLTQINDKLEQLQATSDLYRALGGGVE
ncbi:MAG: efflux transporter outer membrane subunit [Bacteroides sp.]|nr:efflux transporter outer membrane subunit [Bacteroides sp.]